MSGYALETPVLAVFSAVQAWLMYLTGLDINHVIQGRLNGAPMPAPSCIIMTQVQQKNLSSFDLTYNTTAQTETVNNSFDYVIQCDCYGTGAGDLATAIATVFDSEPGCDFFESYCEAQGTASILPLYSDDPLSMAFTNEEQQYEQRYIVKLHLVVNTGVILPMQFMQSVSVTTVNSQTIPR
jgi:hypothetical protein